MLTDQRVDAYIARQADFARPILVELRDRMHRAAPALSETIKWNMPFFMHGGRVLANMAAFNRHASFGFWQHGVAATGKEGEAMGQFGKLTSVADLPDAAYFAEMVGNAVRQIVSGAGKPMRASRSLKPDPVIPPELAVALAGNPQAAGHFNDFAQSCRREYCDWIGEAKRQGTRDKRTAEAVRWLEQGKRRNWKYENC